MIRWTDAAADAKPASLRDLRGELSVADAITLFRPCAALARVVVPDAIRDTVLSYLRTSRGERGGLLLGRVFQRRCRGDSEQVIWIRDAVPSEKFDSTGVSLRMDTHIWDKARDRLKDGWAIVGWFHSHPNLGAFFSGTDRATQRAFFSNAYSLGWVIDPIRAEEAWFLGAMSVQLDTRSIFREVRTLPTEAPL